MKTLSSHLFATLAMLLLSVSAASADSHALVGDASQGWFENEPGPTAPHDAMWGVLVAPLAAPPPPSVIIMEPPAADPPVREHPVRTAPTWTAVEEVEEHVRGGLALVSYLVSS